jgi:hypothetical protein
MRRQIRLAVAGVSILISGSMLAAQPERPLVGAMRNVYRLTTYTAFDWISAHYLKGTLTLQGFSRTERLKQQAEEAARKASGIDEVINQIEVLPAGQGDDNIRQRS